jgi:hypothetical protein
MKCSIWTVLLGVIAVPAAMILGSGHASTGAVVAVLATLLLLPAVAAWQVVGMSTGPVVGGIAAAIAQFAWLFLWVYLVRRFIASRKKGVARDAR